MKKLIFIFLGVSLSVGCGKDIFKFHQDPLTGEDTKFKDGRPVPEKPVYDKPVDSDAIRFNTPDFVSLEEGKETEFEIGARILIPDYVTELKIVNLSDFPGATFDPATGKVNWKPPVGYVVEGGGSSWLERRLQLRATAVKTDAPVLIKEREIALRVTREYTAPEITIVTKESDAMREGESRNLRIRVRDLNAVPADERTWPLVTFTNVNNQRSLAAFMAPVRKVSLSNNEYQLDYKINLQEAELTSSAQVYTTGIVAVSQAGKRSLQSNMTVLVLTSFSDPISSWKGTQVFRAGETRSFQFVVFDPKQEVKLTFNRFRDVPAGAAIQCAPSDMPSLLACSIEWTPAPDQAGAQSYIYVNLGITNTDSRDTAIRNTNIYLSYRVDAAAVGQE